jgi:hypothetical protein
MLFLHRMAHQKPCRILGPLQSLQNHLDWPLDQPYLLVIQDHVPAHSQRSSHSFFLPSCALRAKQTRTRTFWTATHAWSQAFNILSSHTGSTQCLSDNKTAPWIGFKISTNAHRHTEKSNGAYCVDEICGLRLELCQAALP